MAVAAASSRHHHHPPAATAAAATRSSIQRQYALAADNDGRHHSQVKVDLLFLLFDDLLFLSAGRVL